MHKPIVSIIITCYNLGEYLQEAIDSIKRYPNHEDYEIILVYDGSTNENTKTIIEQLIQNNLHLIVENGFPVLNVKKATMQQDTEEATDFVSYGNLTFPVRIRKPEFYAKYFRHLKLQLNRFDQSKIKPFLRV